MNKNSINTAIPATLLVAHATILHPKPKAARRNWKEIVTTAILALVAVALFDVAVINLVLFPECNRITNDCFLVHHLWGAQ